MVPVFSLMIARYCAIITGKAADQTTRSGSNGDDDGRGDSERDGGVGDHDDENLIVIFSYANSY